MDYKGAKGLVLEEIDQTLSAVDPLSVDELIDRIQAADKVFVVGVGRVMLMLQAFAKRLNHIGVEAYFVGEINEPAITPNDLLIVGSGSGESVVPVSIVKVAAKHGAGIVHIGSNANSTVGSYSQLLVRIPCRTKLNLSDEIDSRQPMSSLFEQSLLLFLDVVALMIVQRNQIDIKSLWQKHANLE